MALSHKMPNLNCFLVRINSWLTSLINSLNFQFFIPEFCVCCVPSLKEICHKRIWKKIIGCINSRCEVCRRIEVFYSHDAYHIKGYSIQFKVKKVILTFRGIEVSDKQTVREKKVWRPLCNLKSMLVEMYRICWHVN